MGRIRNIPKELGRRRQERRNQRQENQVREAATSERRRQRSLYRMSGLNAFAELDLSPYDEKWLQEDDIIVTPGPNSPRNSPHVMVGRWSPSGIVLTSCDSPVFTGDALEVKGADAPSPVFVTQVKRVEGRSEPVRYHDACYGKWRTGHCLVDAHLEIAWSVTQSRPMPERLYIDEIDSFASVRGISAHDVAADLHNGRIEASEDDVQSCIEGMIGESYHKKDWGGEENDLYTTRILVDGDRIQSAFLLKGNGKKSKELTLADCGANGDQIVRALQSPARLYLIQYVGPISENVIKDIQDKVRLRRLRGEDVSYCIIDGTDTARLLRAAAINAGA